MSARKDDGGKARYDLIPADVLEKLAKMYALGAEKYGDRNWEQGLSWGRVFAALNRHLWAWWNREEYDDEDGQHHLDSVVWCAMALRAYSLRNKGEDDRRALDSPRVSFDESELANRVAEIVAAVASPPYEIIDKENGEQEIRASVAYPYASSNGFAQGAEHNED